MSLRRGLLSFGSLVVCVLAIADFTPAIEKNNGSATLMAHQKETQTDAALLVSQAVDTICASALLTLTLNPSNSNCTNPSGPVLFQEIFGIPTIISRSFHAPYTPGDSVEIEIQQMTLKGTHPWLGQLYLRSSAIFPSIGKVGVGATDFSGNLTSGTSYFDMYFEIDVVNTGTTLYNSVPIRTQASISSLPMTAGTNYLKVSASSFLLRDQLFDNPAGYLCNVTQSIVACICCNPPRRGDLNGDGVDANILDLTFAVDRIFRNGPLPTCLNEGDVNNDGDVCNILDLTKLVDRIFRNGPLMADC